MIYVERVEIENVFIYFYCNKLIKVSTFNSDTIQLQEIIVSGIKYLIYFLTI